MVDDYSSADKLHIDCNAKRGHDCLKRKRYWGGLQLVACFLQLPLPVDIHLGRMFHRYPNAANAVRQEPGHTWYCYLPAKKDAENKRVMIEDLFFSIFHSLSGIFLMMFSTAKYVNRAPTCGADDLKVPHIPHIECTP